MADSVTKVSSVVNLMMQLSFDLDTDLDQNEHKSCGKTLGRKPLVRKCSVPTSASTATEPLRTPVPYTRSYRGDLARHHGCVFKQHPTRLHRNAQLMSRHRLHAIELKVKGPHLCDLPLASTLQLFTRLSLCPYYCLFLHPWRAALRKQNKFPV